MYQTTVFVVPYGISKSHSCYRLLKLVSALCCADKVRQTTTKDDDDVLQKTIWIVILAIFFEFQTKVEMKDLNAHHKMQRRTQCNFKSILNFCSFLLDYYLIAGLLAGCLNQHHPPPGRMFFIQSITVSSN